MADADTTSTRTEPVRCIVSGRGASPVAAHVCVCVAVLFFALRKRAVSVELGAMSTQWIAEQRSNEHTYSGR